MPKLQTDYPAYLAVRASAQTAEAIRDEAERDGRTLSDLIREALQQRFPERSPRASPERASLCSS